MNLTDLLALFRPARAEPVAYQWFSAQEVRALFDLTAQASSHPEALTSGQAPAPSADDRTCSDLQLDRYLEVDASECSIVGRQWLYRRLRSLSAPERLQELVAYCGPADASAVQDGLGMQHLQALRTLDLDLATPLYKPLAHQQPAWVQNLWWVPALFCAASALLFFSVPTAAALAAVALACAVWVETRLHQALVQWLAVRRAINSLVRVGVALKGHFEATGFPVDQFLPGTVRALSNAPELRRLFRPTVSESVPGLVEYANLLTLYEYRRKAHHLHQLLNKQAALCDLLSALGRLEALAHVARHLQLQERKCWSTPAAQGLVMEAVGSPLLKTCAPLDVRLVEQGIALTGKNGIGKSTLLRTIGLNVLTANAFGFCYGRRACVAPLAVMTSMQVVDSLEQAKSTYMAQLERAKQLLDAGRASNAACHDTLVMVDELFAGTNHLESVSAACAVLAALCEHARVIAATHDVLLVSLLSQKLEPMRLLSRDDAHASLSLEPGTIAQTNGIEMMSDFGYEPELLAAARQTHRHLAEQLTAQPRSSQEP